MEAAAVATAHEAAIAAAGEAMGDLLMKQALEAEMAASCAAPIPKGIPPCATERPRAAAQR